MGPVVCSWLPQFILSLSLFLPSSPSFPPSTLPLPCSQKSLELCLRLYNGYKRVADILTEKGGSGAGGSKRGPGSLAAKALHDSTLSLSGVTRLLEALFWWVAMEIERAVLSLPLCLSVMLFQVISSRCLS